MPCFLTHTTHLPCLHVTPSPQHSCLYPSRCVSVRELFFTSQNLCSSCLSAPATSSSSSLGDWSDWSRTLGSYTRCQGSGSVIGESGAKWTSGTGWGSGCGVGWRSVAGNASMPMGNRPPLEMLGCHAEGRGVYEIDVSEKGKRRVLQQQAQAQQARRAGKAGQDRQAGRAGQAAEGKQQGWGGWFKSILSASTNVQATPRSMPSSTTRNSSTPRSYNTKLATSIEADDWEVEEAELAESRRGNSSWTNEKWLESWVELEIPVVDLDLKEDLDLDLEEDLEEDLEGDAEMEMVEREVECY
ncbi:hypothetical protein FPQ18DRAFT_300988 [Pyronema domesticum]|uniref:Uncharacterized protein n=1 Tax=Pyronema omphalodes (strain CBS 100304) TaxID=1076935 RepID=U4L0A1_PYROM|nr:hypothetical protein FPQ18DRAFT_300988 [Pyronema domesticum]CCX07979.1 Protein of unknown function [Pyronema omphalodes CBS 100304]